MFVCIVFVIHNYTEGGIKKKYNVIHAIPAL